MSNSSTPRFHGSEGKLAIFAGIFCSLVALVALLVSAPIPEDDDSEPKNGVVGQVIQVSGDLSVAGYPAMVGTTVFDGDTLKTGSSAAVVALVEGTMVYLGSHSQAQLASDGDQISVFKRLGKVVKTGDAESAEMEESIVILTKSSRRGSKGKPPSPKGDDDDDDDDDQGDDDQGEDED